MSRVQDAWLEEALQAEVAPPESEPMRILRQMSSVACDAELRISATHDADVLARLQVMHEGLRRLVADGQLGTPADGQLPATFIADLAKQIRHPDRRPVNVLACRIMLDLWVPDWETELPELAAVINERQPPHAETPWAAIPIRGASWQ